MCALNFNPPPRFLEDVSFFSCSFLAEQLFNALNLSKSHLHVFFPSSRKLREEKPLAFDSNCKDALETVFWRCFCIRMRKPSGFEGQIVKQNVSFLMLKHDYPKNRKKWLQSFILSK